MDSVKTIKTMKLLEELAKIADEYVSVVRSEFGTRSGKYPEGWKRPLIAAERAAKKARKTAKELRSGDVIMSGSIGGRTEVTSNIEQCVRQVCLKCQEDSLHRVSHEDEKGRLVPHPTCRDCWPY